MLCIEGDIQLIIKINIHYKIINNMIYPIYKIKLFILMHFKSLRLKVEFIKSNHYKI
jgi:hypothetical protein